MRLTTFTDYSLRLLLYLAAAPEGRATIAEVARAYGISTNHLVKVAHLLGQHGLLNTMRGRGGGLSLAQPPEEIRIGRIVRLAEHGDAAPDCLGGACRSCKVVAACRLPRMLAEAMGAFYAVLDTYTLADAMRSPAKVAALLGMPVAAPRRTPA